MMKSVEKVLVVSLLLVFLSGCATSRGVLEIQEPAASVNPAEGVALKFERISDNRKFEINPKQPDIPSLKNNEINDQLITSRAIARKRNSYGKALGDILLPEGQTVVGVVEKSLTRGLRENGYRVLIEGEAGYDDALPLETLIRVYGPVGPFIDGEEFDSQVALKFQVASSANWQKTIQASMDELNRDIAEDIRVYRQSHEAVNQP
jgi:hypothetical protein